MKNSKVKLLSIITENRNISDINEMPKFWSKKKPGERVGTSKLYDQNGAHIGWDMMVDPFNQDPDSERVQIVFTSDIETFMNENPDVVEKLKKDYGSFRWSEGKLPEYRPFRDVRVGNPLPGEEGEPIRTIKQTSKDVSTGEKLEGTKKVTRFTKDILRKFLRDDIQFKQDLNNRSIPHIDLDDKKFADRFTKEFTNEKITFTTHGINEHKSSEDFNQRLSDSIFGENVPELPLLSVARLFNVVNRNWRVDDKMLSKQDLGVTDVFKLRKSGFKSTGSEIYVEQTFKLYGELNENTFSWSVSLKVNFGQSKPDSTYVRGRIQQVEFNPDSILDNKSITASTSVLVSDRNKPFDPSYTIMDDPNIVDGLKQTLAKFKEKISNVDKSSLLNLTTSTRSVSGVRNRRNESVVSKMVKNIISEIKIDKKP